MKNTNKNLNPSAVNQLIHQVIFLLVVIWLGFFGSFFMAYKRVSDHPHFTGEPFKSWSLDTKYKQ